MNFTTMTEWERELQEAEKAWREGNEGRARAGCRRAVGAVLKRIEEQNGQNLLTTNPSNALERIRSLSVNPQIPPPIRDAARRLTMNIRYRLSPDFTFNPILDARKIINFFLVG